MALSNYTELKSAIADTLNRDDLTAVIPTFIKLAEAQINRDVRHWEMETCSLGQQTGGEKFGAVPPDWLETIRLTYLGTKPVVLNQLSLADMASMRQSTNDTAGTPMYYCHFSGQFEYFPTPSADSDFELLYYAKTPSLETNATNWLLRDAPDIYLYGSLIHSAPYLQDDARLAVWSQMYSAAVQRLNDSSQSAKYSGSGLRMRIRGL